MTHSLRMGVVCYIHCLGYRPDNGIMIRGSCQELESTSSSTKRSANIKYLIQNLDSGWTEQLVPWQSHQIAGGLFIWSSWQLYAVPSMDWWVGSVAFTRWPATGLRSGFHYIWQTCCVPWHSHTGQYIKTYQFLFLGNCPQEKKNWSVGSWAVTVHPENYFLCQVSCTGLCYAFIAWYSVPMTVSRLKISGKTPFGMYFILVQPRFIWKLLLLLHTKYFGCTVHVHGGQ